MDSEVSRVTITVTPDDLIERRAFVHLSPEAKIKLLHMAGAPWQKRQKKDGAWTLHDRQIEALTRPERTKIIHGGSRWGKSVAGGGECLIDAMIPYTRTAIGASRYDHVNHEFKYVVSGFRELFKGAQHAFSRFTYKHTQHYHEYHIECVWGSLVRGYSVADDEGAVFLGQEFSRIVLGEGSHIDVDIADRKIKRALDGAMMASLLPTGYLTIYTTPKSHGGASAAEHSRALKRSGNCLPKLHYGRVPFAESFWFREADVLENPAYDKRVYEARRKELPKHAFDEQYRGMMTYKTGAIFKELREERHLNPAPPAEIIRGMRFGIGIDTGTYFAASLVGVTKVGEPSRALAWGLGEVYLSQTPIDECCEAINEMVLDVLAPVFGIDDIERLRDRIDIWVVDPASQHKIDLMEHLNVTLSHPSHESGGAGKFELIPTIDQMRAYFRNDQLLLADTLVQTHQQLSQYVWKQRKGANLSGKDPVIVEPDKNRPNHLCDSLRLVTIPLMQLGPLEEPPPPMTIKEQWEAQQQDRLWGQLKRQMSMGGTMRKRIGDVW